MKKFFKNVAFYLHAGDYSLVYFGVLLFTVTIFGYAGIWRGITLALEKKALITQFESLEQELMQKDEVMLDTQKNLKEVQPYLAYFDQSLPAEPNLEDYLQEVALSFSKVGFTLTKFSVAEVEEQTLTLEIDLLGPEGNIPSLLKSIDTLTRLTVLDKLETAVGNKETKTNLKLKVYYIK